jgi:hypothetical protein
MEPAMKSSASSLRKIVLAEALPNYRLRLRFDDDIEGVIDFSAEAGKGIFTIWATPQVFATFQVHNGRRIAWPEEVDLCADALYLEVTGQQPEDLFPQLKGEAACA